MYLWWIPFHSTSNQRKCAAGEYIISFTTIYMSTWRFLEVSFSQCFNYTMLRWSSSFVIAGPFLYIFATFPVPISTVIVLVFSVFSVPSSFYVIIPRIENLFYRSYFNHIIITKIKSVKPIIYVATCNHVFKTWLRVAINYCLDRLDFR